MKRGYPTRKQRKNCRQLADYLESMSQHDYKTLYGACPVNLLIKQTGTVSPALCNLWYNRSEYTPDAFEDHLDHLFFDGDFLFHQHPSVNKILVITRLLRVVHSPERKPSLHRRFFQWLDKGFLFLLQGDP